eukprot:gene6823-8462_t
MDNNPIDTSELQQQEIEVIKSIFVDTFTLEGTGFCKIKVSVDVPEDFKIGHEHESEDVKENGSSSSSTTTTTTTTTTTITTTSTVSNEEVGGRSSSSSSSSLSNPIVYYPISFLPSITLGLDLPHDYPELSPPKVYISCCWLSIEQMKSIIKELNSMWEPGESVIFKYVSWAKESLLSFLGFTDTLLLTSDPVQDHFNGDGDGDELENYCEWEHQTGWVSLVSSIPLLLAHHGHEFENRFRQMTHTCPVCYCDYPGEECTLLKCHHFICTGCTSQVISININDGQIKLIKCTEPGCSQNFDLSVIKRLITPKMFQQYQDMMMKTSGHIECPRCQNWATVDAKSRSSYCTSCYYTACIMCRKSWHPGVGCDNKGREKPEGMSTNDMRNCPGCGIVIYRYEGCNKMTCSICGTWFCWICNQSITSYEHFGKKCELFEIPSELRRVQKVRFSGSIISGNRFCNRCKKRVFRYDFNNHLQCYNCKSEQCFLCNATIKGTQHFMTTSCSQHGGTPTAPTK